MRYIILVLLAIVVITAEAQKPYKTFPTYPERHYQIDLDQPPETRYKNDYENYIEDLEDFQNTFDTKFYVPQFVYTILSWIFRLSDDRTEFLEEI